MASFFVEVMVPVTLMFCAKLAKAQHRTRYKENIPRLQECKHVHIQVNLKVDNIYAMTDLNLRAICSLTENG